MLTIQQADILSLLADFNCLRSSHIKNYIAAKHNSSHEQMAAMLNQLKIMGRIMMSDGYVMLPGRKINTNLISAFDVMMDLTNGDVILFFPGRNPITLMFSVVAECSGSQSSFPCESDNVITPINNFGVVSVEPYCESSICGRLRSIDRDMTLIFILCDIEQQKMIKVENKSYFAIQGESGKYKFFKAVYEPQNKS